MHEECAPVASTLNLQWPLILWSPSRMVDPKGAKGIELTNCHLVTFAGGIPLKDVDRQIIGSIGVSGGAGDSRLCSCLKRAISIEGLAKREERSLTCRKY
jgi:hypothetical protein